MNVYRDRMVVHTNKSWRPMNIRSRQRSGSSEPQQRVMLVNFGAAVVYNCLLADRVGSEPYQPVARDPLGSEVGASAA